MDKKEFVHFCENLDVARAVERALESMAKAAELKKLKGSELSVSNE